MASSLPSIADLLDPDTLAAFIGERPAVVTVRPFGSADSFSGSQLEIVEAVGTSSTRFVLKHVRMANDWLMQLTHDSLARAVAAWESDLLAMLPDEIVHGVLLCAREGDRAAILMRDLGQAMFPPGDLPIGVDENVRLLRAMAIMHATFWEREGLADPAAGFIELRDHVALLTPSSVQPLVGRGYGIPELAAEGWEMLRGRAAADLWAALRSVVDDVTPVVEAMLETPQTVLHGDCKLGNFGLTHELVPRVVLIDWAMVGPGPGAFDLAWYLAVNSARLPVSKEACIETYRAALGDALGPRFSESWWERQLALSLLGGFLLAGWQKALGAFGGTEPSTVERELAEVGWWSARALEGARLL